MKFFDRAHELELLADIGRRSRDNAQFTVLTGRRRVGKTSLLMRAFPKSDFAYLFVERKSEKDLCQTFKEELESQLGMVIYGEPNRFTHIFEEIMRFASKKPITVVIDEFQEFIKVNPSVFSGIQKIWDLHKDNAKINLIVSGSVYTLIQKIFKSKKAALYGRETAFIKIDPFRVSVLKEILNEYSPGYSNEDLLALWAFTGGVAKYVEMLIDAGAVTRDKMIDFIVREDSPFIDEGRAVLVDEFGKEYGSYFSILSAIASGRTTRNEITQAIGRDAGGFLTRLESDYAIISKKQPLFAASSAKSVRYCLSDSFFVFWFRFIFKYGYLLEIKGYDRLREIIRRDYDVFSGFALERYFRELFIESGKWTRLGSWWDRKGENEIDLLAENELDDTYAVCEVKRVKSRIDLDYIKSKYDAFVKASGKWKCINPQFLALSLDDM
ncbi:MAG: AAA family ATPase [Kiritimatiellae bacterium]|nr:AAA family ATPase [Kiritimatiellia bacterium]